MKRWRQKPILVNVRNCPHRAPVSHSQQIEIIRVLAKFRQHRNRVQARAVVVQLAFNLPKLARKNKVPIAPRTAVVSPVRNCRIVGKDGIQRHVRFFLEAKILHPRIDFFLPRGIPRHLASERIRFLLPAISSCAHLRFQVVCLRIHSFAPEVCHYFKENISFHLTKYRVVWCEFDHRDGCFIRVR